MSLADRVIQATESTHDGLVVKAGGEINFTRSPQFRVELMEVLRNGPRRLVIDLSGVPYMDSSGVATLVEALQVQSRSGGKLVLCGLQPRVQSIFEIARLTSVFQIAPDTQTATKM